MRLARIKPGSLTSDGQLFDYMGDCYRHGPCWLDITTISPTRKGMIGRAGWHVLSPPNDRYLGIPPRDGLICVYRLSRCCPYCGNLIHGVHGRGCPNNERKPT